MDERKLFDAFLAFLSDFKDEVEQSVTDKVEKRLKERLHAKVFYTLKDLEQMTGITHEALKGRIKRGTLKAIKDGNTFLVTKDEVERFIERLNKQRFTNTMRA